MTTVRAWGADVGGHSIKHALVDGRSGDPLTPLASALTPSPLRPEALVAAIASLAADAPPDVALGVALPCVIRGGVVYTAANVDASLVGIPVQQRLADATGRKVACLNDADAAGLAEVHWGAGRGASGTARGTTMVLTFGTGIGSALFTDGKLVANTELGHLQMGKAEAEHRASARARTAENLDWPAWSVRVNEYLALIDALFWPELIVIGGSVVENYARFGPLLRARAELRPAKLGPGAGVAGAALAALQT